MSPNGSAFGAIRAGNAHFWGTSGLVGIAAANIQVQGSVVIGDLWAVDTATPVLTFGNSSQIGAVIVAGGDLSRPNGKRIFADGYPFIFGIAMAEGRTSNNVVLPQQPLRGQLTGNGVFY